LFYATPSVVPAKLSASVDLRKITLLYNQENQGSSTANAIAWAVEFEEISQYKKRNHKF
jgi:hypothetical protein